MEQERMATRLRALRETKGVSCKQLAAALGVAYGQVWSWEMGKYDPNLFMLECLAVYYDCTLDYLAGLADHPKLTRFDVREGAA